MGEDRKALVQPNCKVDRFFDDGVLSECPFHNDHSYVHWHSSSLASKITNSLCVSVWLHHVQLSRTCSLFPLCLNNKPWVVGRGVLMWGCGVGGRNVCVCV